MARSLHAREDFYSEYFTLHLIPTWKHGHFGHTPLLKKNKNVFKHPCLLHSPLRYFVPLSLPQQHWSGFGPAKFYNRHNLVTKLRSIFIAFTLEAASESRQIRGWQSRRNNTRQQSVSLTSRLAAYITSLVCSFSFSLFCLFTCFFFSSSSLPVIFISLHLLISLYILSLHHLLPLPHMSCFSVFSFFLPLRVLQHHVELWIVAAWEHSGYEGFYNPRRPSSLWGRVTVSEGGDSHCYVHGNTCRGATATCEIW